MKLLGVAVLVMLGCGAKEPSPGSGPPLKTCVTPPEPACTYTQCGANSASINAFPINGLREDGECTPDGSQLVPGSLQNADCAGATLSMEGKKLVGRKADGTIQCKNAKLLGATFVIRTQFGEEKLEIVDIVDYAPDPEEPDKTVTAYRIAWVKETETDSVTKKKKGLCTSKRIRKLRKALKMKYVEYTDYGDLPDPKLDLVIPVRSELYTRLGDPVGIDPSWKDKTTNEWLNLACVDDALAKRTMHHQTTSDISRNRAFLRMWTADYCGGVPFTKRGEGINWKKQGNLEIEAQWSETGATCVTAPRVLRDEAGVAAPPTDMPKRLRDHCKSPAGGPCTSIADWMTAATTCMKDGPVGQDGKPVPVVDHIIPLCPTTSCTGAGCPVESRIPKGPVP